MWLALLAPSLGHNYYSLFFRSYSYYIEVSMDQKDWVKVIDHSKYLCRSWQDLYFTPRVVRYIRIVGTYNTLNKVFHVVSLEAYYTKKSFQIHKGILSKYCQFTKIRFSYLWNDRTCLMPYVISWTQMAEPIPNKRKKPWA